ncbi:MAG TPA: exodeoxyribonuclease VIII, partial [Desulfobacterales bacterium]|nr:exodeoxyribonuclease VIII [Desulfobacterales bacterium]
IVDLKTTIDASPESFARSCVNFGYHRQEALYRMIYKLHFGEEPRGFIFVAVEKEPPYAVGVYVLGEEELNLGYNQINNAIDIYLECIRFDTWPSYSEKIITLDYPKWAFK